MSDRRCLVVDDEPDIRVLLRGFLTSRGWTVDEAPSGTDALAHDLNEYDLIVLDQRMPGLTGYETGVQMRVGGFERPIIFYSAHVTPELEEDLHANIGLELHIISKPDLERLLRVIDKLSSA